MVFGGLNLIVGFKLKSCVVSAYSGTEMNRVPK